METDISRSSLALQAYVSWTVFWGVAFKVILKSSLRLVLHLSSEAALDTETSFDV